MSELLQKESLIDKIAVENKNMQKKCDALRSELQEEKTTAGNDKDLIQSLKEEMQDGRIEQDLLKNRNKDLEDEVEKLKEQVAALRDQHEDEVNKLAADYDNKFLSMNQKMDAAIEEKLEQEKLRAEAEAEHERIRSRTATIQDSNMVPIVEPDNYSVQDGFDRLRRLCQVKKKRHD